MNKIRGILSLLAAFLVITLSTIFIYALPGDLDTSFGTGGTVRTDINGNDDARAIKIQPDGKILVAGIANNSASIVSVRYNSDGTLDTGYGTNGKIVSALIVASTVQTIKFQPDNKIVTGGFRTTTTYEVVVQRYNTDGSADTAFGTNGAVTQGVGIGAALNDIAFQPDGKIVAVGYKGTTQQVLFLAIRLTSGGVFDTDFNGTGIYTGPQQISGTAYSVAVQSNGKIIIAGTNPISGATVGVWIRLNANGTTDGGLHALQGAAYNILIQPDGKLLFGTYLNYKATLERAKNDDSVDTDFGVNGKATAPFSYSSIGDMVLQSDGKIIIGGSAGDSNLDFALARFLPNGTLDTAFGSGGGVVTLFGTGNDYINAISLQPDNKIVAVGTAQFSNYDFTLARYLNGDAPTAPARTRFDFDGDAKADIAVFRPSNGTWYINRSGSGATSFAFGISEDKIAPADYDGDGKTDYAVFRPSSGTWYLQRSTGGFVGVAFGQSGDIPVPGDFDGDGKADISVFRPSNGAWYRINSSNGQFAGLLFGQSGDKPQIADYDGDGKSDIAVVRPDANAVFYWLESSTGQFKAAVFGLGADIPTPADFDGDGKTDIAVYRPSTSSWYRYNSSNNEFFQLQFGQNGDIPVAADYDGNGTADIAVFRPSNQIWYLNNFTAVTFGANTDKPVEAAFQ